MSEIVSAIKHRGAPAQKDATTVPWFCLALEADRQLVLHTSRDEEADAPV